MPSPILTAISLAGFLFAQVSAVISELPDEDVKPVAFVIKGAEQRFILFPGDTLEAMVEAGRRELRDNPKYDGWALAYEGFVVQSGNRQSALLVEAWSRGASKPVLIAQAWKRAAGHKGVMLIGDPVVLKHEDAPKAGSPRVAAPTALDEGERKAFRDGIEQLQRLRAQGLL